MFSLFVPPPGIRGKISAQPGACKNVFLGGGGVRGNSQQNDTVITPIAKTDRVSRELHLC